MEPKIIHSDPEILSGTPVFVGTRVPAQNLFDCLEAGDSIDRFLDQFPTVRREQAVGLQKAAAQCTEHPHEVLAPLLTHSSQTT